MPQPDHYSARRELLDVLMEKASGEVYPSTTMLDMIEGLLTPDEIPGYAQWLIGRIRSDRFPSIALIERVRQYA